MTASRPLTAPAGLRTTLLLAGRIAGREMRAGLRGFYVLIACMALSVMAIAGVNSVASGLANGLAQEGRVILGGDLAFNLSLREANPAERSFLERQGWLSVAATMRAMARIEDGRSALVEVKAVDRSYPLYGTVVLDRNEPLAAVLAEHAGTFGAAADPVLMARLDLAPGARIRLGSAVIEIRAALTSEPDKLASGIGFGPRLLISEEALRATGLLAPGSIVRWHYRVELASNDAIDAASTAVATAARTQFPDAGWEIRSSANASPSLAQNVERFTQYLTLVGLTALLIGGVGVGNAVRAHIERRTHVIATLKSVGATGGRVFAIYLAQVMALAALGALPGLAVGAAFPFLIVWAFAAVLPLPLLPALYPGALALALLYGLFAAMAFALWPLGRAHDVPASALFRNELTSDWHRPRLRYMAATALAIGALAAFALGAAYDRRVAAVFILGAGGVFALLYLLARLLMFIARSATRLQSPIARFAMANIHRPGALTPSIVLSLGLGLTLLVTVVALDGNLRVQFLAALPRKAPSLYFVDIPVADADRFERFVRARVADASFERVPMMRGRIIAVNGVPAENLRPGSDTAWALQSDRGITYADSVPPGSRLVAGQWWNAGYDGPPLVSFEQRIADGLSLKLGDSVSVNVLGRNISATVANFRALDWQSLGINFVMVFSPNTFRGAPHTQIATLTYPAAVANGEEIALLKAVGEAFPAVTVLRVRDVLEAVGTTVTNLVLGIRAASGLTLMVAVLVLGGALAAGHRRRVYEAVVLKTLGATRKRLLAAYVIEYLVLGLATASLGVIAGSATAAFVLGRFMHLPFVWLPGPLLACALCAVLGTVSLGLVGTFRALGQRAAPVLRDL